MKRKRGTPFRAIALLASLFLAGCANLPSWLQGGQAQQFHPLDAEVARIAAPQPPAPAPAATPLLCRVGRGDAHFSKGWSAYLNASFSLPPDARVTIALPRKKGDEKIDILGIFDSQGQKLIFCPVVDGPPDKRVACTSLYALDEDLKAGIKRTFDIPAAVRGASITCAYREEALQKL